MKMNKQLLTEAEFVIESYGKTNVVFYWLSDLVIAKLKSGSDYKTIAIELNISEYKAKAAVISAARRLDDNFYNKSQKYQSI